MGNLGWTEILIILGLALIIFGPRKLPQLGKSLGESLAQFRRASEDFKRTWEQEVDDERRKVETLPYLQAPENYSNASESESSAESVTTTLTDEKVVAEASEPEAAVAESK